MHSIANFFGVLGRFFGAVPREVFGPRVDTGWGIAASIYVSVITIAFLIAGYRSIHELGKAADIRFDKERLDRYNVARPDGTPPREINWELARKEQVRSLRYTIPFGVLVLGTLFWWVRESFTLKAYFELAVCWLIAAPLLRVWWIATVVWCERKLIKAGFLHHQTLFRSPQKQVRSTPTIGQAVKHYLNWGLQKSTKKRQPYIGIFRVFNPLIKLFGLRWLQPRLTRPLFVCAFYACIWTLSTPVSVFYLTHEFEERTKILKPEWASRHAPEPTYGSGAIPDTPGDAQAALS